MQKMRFFYRINFLLLFILSLIFGAQGQIEISAGDLLSLIGKTQILEQDSSEVVIDLGSPGANQVWDHRNIQFQGVFSVMESFEEVESTPFAGEFPSSNFVQHISNELIEGDIYNFYKIDSDRFTGLGDAFTFTFGGMNFTDVSKSESLEAPLPLTMGAEWTSIIRDTFSEAGISIIDYDSTVNLVDGWGTLRLPLGDFDCLRIKSKSYCTSTTSFGGMSSEETNTEITYVWLSKENFVLSTISHSDAEEENFSSSEFYSRIASTSGTTGLKDQLTLKGLEVKIYPNPFIKQIQVQLNLDHYSKLSVDVFDLGQRNIHTLVDGELNSGKHEFIWNPTENISAGQYFLRIASPGGVVVRPLVKL